MIDAIMGFLAIASFVWFMICVYSGHGKTTRIQFITGFRIVRERIKRWVQKRRENNDLFI